MTNGLLINPTISEEDYMKLLAADVESDGDVARVLNANGLASWTVCPHCHCDDFTHAEDCVADEI